LSIYRTVSANQLSKDNRSVKTLVRLFDEKLALIMITHLGLFTSTESEYCRRKKSKHVDNANSFVHLLHDVSRSPINGILGSRSLRARRV